MSPFAKTGGLGETVSALASAVCGKGHEVSVFMPRYRCIDIQKWGLEIEINYFEVIIGNTLEATRVFSKKLDDGVKVYFIEHPDYFQRDDLYGTPVGDYQDNDRRFTYFQRATLKAIEYLKLRPEVIHCHDWQTGLIPVYLKAVETKYAPFRKAKSILTVHDFGFQGNFPPDSFPSTGLGWEYYKSDLLEFYSKFSFLKGGLVFADEVVTVSEHYSREVQTKEFGSGMEGGLAARKDTVTGILNGLDVDAWDPSKDRDIESRYSMTTLSKRRANKTLIQKEHGFAVDHEVPLIGLVSYLSTQKGLDILIPAFEMFADMNIQVVLLGTGEELYHQVLRDLAKRNKAWLGVHILFDLKMARQFYAGCDMMFFPSHHEPSSLGHLIACRYGAIPVAHATGCLADAIQPFDLTTGTGNGFLFEKDTTESLVDAVKRAVSVFKKEKLWKALVKNAMGMDFSWSATAEQYIQLYETVKRRTVKVAKV